MVTANPAVHELPFPAVWLRHNCPCHQCRDPRSLQRFIHVTDIAPDVSVSGVEETDTELIVTFGPDGHRSVFDREWLRDQTPDSGGDGRDESHKHLWRASDFERPLVGAEWSTYRSDDLERLHVLRRVRQLGLAVLHGTPTDEGTVLDVARTFGFVRETNYGALFDVRIESDPSNLAFTSLAIGPHTDNPYRDPVPTIQLLHCLTNGVEGGETGLVDGFYAAARLRVEHPRYFDVLTTTPVLFAWADEANDLRAHRPLIELNVAGNIRGVRLNNRSMQPMKLAYDRVVEFYDAYRCFADVVERADLHLTLRLEPGDCLVFDNTRVLHARTAFDESVRGARHLQGCYADLDGLDSSVSVLTRNVQAKRPLES